ncbi:MAG TPA: DUF2231 domain-containing protein [Nocardioidaceae bacterium]|nr:DUF2231 domain-containing protein [Nocardioidaceae bacterium]
MEIAGLPVHPLVVHAAVTLIPLSALFAIAFVVLPRWRWLSRWPTALLAVAALAVAWVARLSGAALLDSRPELARLVAEHQTRGQLLSLVAIPYAVIVVLAAWSMAGGTALASGRGGQESRIPALETVLAALVVIAALAVLVLVVLTGDSGSRAVWG